MFRSKARPIVITQYEHGRLAGTLASLWGNERFDRPGLDFGAFVEGVTLHDWGYGLVDDVPIREASEADWLTVVRKGIANRFDHPITDIVTKLHLRRLLALDISPVREALIEEIDGLVANRLPESGRTRAEFDWADKITRFCDNVAFDFSFEAPVERTYPISPRVDSNDETAVSYKLRHDGDVLIEPWPFSEPSFSGIVIGYQRESFPGNLIPVVIPYHIHGRC